MEDKSLPHFVLENLQLQKQQVGQKTSQCFHREAGRTTRGSSMHFWVNGMCLSSTPGLARSDTAVLYQRFPMPQTISAGAAEEGKAPAPPLPPATHPCSHDTLPLCLAQQSYGCAAGWISPCAMEKNKTQKNTQSHQNTALLLRSFHWGQLQPHTDPCLGEPQEKETDKSMQVIAQDVLFHRQPL